METETNTKTKTILNAVEELKKAQEQSNKDTDSLVSNKISQLTEEITKGLEVAQKAEMKAKTLESKLDKMEAAYNRVDVDSDAKADSGFLLEQKEKFKSFLSGDLNFKELTIVNSKSMSTDVNPNGGYVVRPELVDLVVKRNFETSPIRQVANVMSGSSKSIEMLIDDDEAEVNRNGEGSASSDTDTPDIGILSINAYKYDAEPSATIEMLEDSYLDIESWLAKKVADRIGRKENTDFVTGAGINGAKGFLSYTAGTATYARGSIEQVNSGTSGAVTADGAIDLQNALHEIYQPNAVWTMKRVTYANYLKLKGTTNDQYLFGVDLLRNGQMQPTLLGKRVIFSDDMPVSAANSLSAAYGDFTEGYTIYDRIGLVMQRDPYTNKAVVKFYTYKRTGGAVTNYQAIKIQKLAV